MSGGAFVDPEVVRLTLSDGVNWIEVKRELTYGEEQKLAASSLRPDSAEMGKTIALDMERFNISRIAMWLTDWSFRDRNDKPVPITPATIGALRSRVAAEIDRLLTQHIQALEAEMLDPTGVSALQ